MKIYKNGELVGNTKSFKLAPIYGMANLKSKITGEAFELWIDEVDSERHTSHNEARFKPKANGIQIDIILHKDGTTEIADNDPIKIQKFGYAKEATKFIERFQEPLLMHWNGEIETGELTAIIRLVVKKNYSIKDAIDVVLSDEY